MELNQVISFIHKADDDAINQIIDALTARYKRVYPGWEVAFTALPLGDVERRRTILEDVLRTHPGK